MKRFIIKIMIFIVGLVIIDFLIGLGGTFLGNHVKGGDHGLNVYICRKMKEECLVFGSSRGMHHYDPNIITDTLGMSCWNCSLDGSGIILMYGRYRLLSERYTPKVIVYDVYSGFDLEVRDNHKDLDNLRFFYDDPSIDSIFWDVDNTERYKMWSSCYRYNSKWIGLISDNLHPLKSNDRGYMPVDRKMTYEPNSLKKSHEEIRYDSLKLAYLEKFIVACKQRNTQLIFTISPCYRRTDDTVYNPLKKMCRKYDITLLNHFCDKDFVFDKNLFYDSVHLNRVGATKYTKKIVGELKSVVEHSPTKKPV